MIYGDFLSSLSLASSHSGGGGGGGVGRGVSLFSLAHGSAAQVDPGHVNRLKPRAPIHAYTKHAQFVKVS